MNEIFMFFSFSSFLKIFWNLERRKKLSLLLIFQGFILNEANCRFWMKKFSQIDCCDTKSDYKREKFHTKRNKIEKKYEFPPDSSIWWYNKHSKS